MTDSQKTTPVAALRALVDAFGVLSKRVEEAAQATQADYILAPPPPPEEDTP